MLILSRAIGEKIIIGEAGSIRITILACRNNEEVTLGISCPKETGIRSGDERSAIEMATLFLDDLPDELEQIEAAHEAKEWTLVSTLELLIICPYVLCEKYHVAG